MPPSGIFCHASHQSKTLIDYSSTSCYYVGHQWPFAITTHEEEKTTLQNHMRPLAQRCRHGVYSRPCVLSRTSKHGPGIPFGPGMRLFFSGFCRLTRWMVAAVKRRRIHGGLSPGRELRPVPFPGSVANTPDLSTVTEAASCLTANKLCHSNNTRVLAKFVPPGLTKNM